MSLYEVSEMVPGKSFLARDLIRGGDPVKVSEGTATNTLKQWDRIAARIVPVLGKTVLAGGLLPFSPADERGSLLQSAPCLRQKERQKAPGHQRRGPAGGRVSVHTCHGCPKQSINP